MQLNSLKEYIGNAEYNIYFVEAYHGIRHFLSLYDPNEKNIIITLDFEAYQNFFKRYFKSALLVTIPVLRVISERNFLHVLYALCVIIFKCLFLRNISSTSNAVFFNLAGSLHFHLIIKYLEKRKLNIVYVDPYKAIAEYRKLDFSELPRREKLQNKLMNLMLGLDCAWYRMPYFDSLGINKSYCETEIELKSWENIRKKINIEPMNEEENAVLIIDWPLQVFSDTVKFVESQTILCRFFSKLIANGKKLYLKAHYARPHINSFDNTEIENSIHMVPSYIPAELIMDDFSEIYLFDSAAALRPCKGKKYSVLNLLSFKNEEIKRSHRDYFKKILADEFDKIHFV